MTRVDGKDGQALEDRQALEDGELDDAGELDGADGADGADEAGEDGGLALGRAVEYREEFADQAMKLCRLGATYEDLADFFGVTGTTLHRWQRAHPEFRDSVKKGKIIADDEAANRLYTRACGFSRKADKIIIHKGITQRVEYMKYYPPDTRACIFWLTNRRPDLWSNKVDISRNTPEGDANSTEGEYHFTPEDEAALRRIADIRESLRQGAVEASDMGASDFETGHVGGGGEGFFE